MDILWWFHDIRTGFLDTFFSLITYFGHILLPMVILCIIYWCYDKRFAYKLGLSFFAGSIILQYVKITCRVPRPWQIDRKFIPVFSALDDASGHSFPSGHSQAAGALYTMFFLNSKKKWFKALMIFLIIIIPISRMYLGVHTLTDVLFGALCGIASSILFFYIYDKISANLKSDIIVSGIILLASVGLIIYASYLKENVDKSISIFGDCFKIGGAGLAFAISYPIEKNFIKFNTETTLIKQIIKTALGIAILLSMRYGIKYLLGSNPKYDLFRYFSMVIVMVLVYPLTFRYLFKPKEKKQNITD